MYSKITDLVVTKHDVTLLVGEIDLLIDSLYQKDSDFETALQTKVRSETAKMIRQTLEGDTAEALKILKEELESLPEVILTLAFDPTEHLISEMVLWIRSQTGKGIILDTRVDSSVIGGAIVEIEGKHADYSLRKKITKMGLLI